MTFTFTSNRLAKKHFWSNVCAFIVNKTKHEKFVLKRIKQTKKNLKTLKVKVIDIKFTIE